MFSGEGLSLTKQGLHFLKKKQKKFIFMLEIERIFLTLHRLSIAFAMLPHP